MLNNYSKTIMHVPAAKKRKKNLIIQTQFIHKCLTMCMYYLTIRLKLCKYTLNYYISFIASIWILEYIYLNNFILLHSIFFIQVLCYW